MIISRSKTDASMVENQNMNSIQIFHNGPSYFQIKKIEKCGIRQVWTVRPLLFIMIAMLNLN